MRIKSEMNVSDLLQIDEEKMLKTLAWLAPDLGRLQSPAPLRSIIGRVSVEQAARITRIPVTEMLYVLNLAAGETERELSEELRSTAAVSTNHRAPCRCGEDGNTARY